MSLELSIQFILLNLISDGCSNSICIHNGETLILIDACRLWWLHTIHLIDKATLINISIKKKSVWHGFLKHVTLELSRSPARLQILYERRASWLKDILEHAQSTLLLLKLNNAILFLN